MRIDGTQLGHKEINEKLREMTGEITLTGCMGQRFIASGMSGKRITVEGVPGNALGAYLNGADIDVMGNAQDAVGDTMNDGRIVIHGSIGDAAGYAMRGGEILVRGNAGYRAGIHMKEYREKRPVIVVGGRTGSFLGEYQAGGLIVVLGLHEDGKPIVGNFPCTGMHGGCVFLRSECKNVAFPKHVSVAPATKEELKDIEPYVRAFCEHFGCDFETIMDSPFTRVVPDSNNPYKQMYVAN